MHLVDAERSAYLYEPHAGRQAADLGRQLGQHGGGRRQLRRPRGVRRQGRGRPARRCVRRRSARRSASITTSAGCTTAPATARSMILVSPGGERTMNTYLGACQQLTTADIKEDEIGAAAITYMEGYLWDPPEAKKAFVAGGAFCPQARAADRDHAVRPVLRQPLPRRIPRPDAVEDHRLCLRQYRRSQGALPDRQPARGGAAAGARIASSPRSPWARRAPWRSTMARSSPCRPIPVRRGGRRDRRRRSVRLGVPPGAGARARPRDGAAAPGASRRRK